MDKRTFSFNAVSSEFKYTVIEQVEIWVKAKEKILITTSWKSQILH